QCKFFTTLSKTIPTHLPTSPICLNKSYKILNYINLYNIYPYRIFNSKTVLQDLSIRPPENFSFKPFSHLYDIAIPYSMVHNYANSAMNFQPGL
ncbi:TPA: hypothetical protein ACKMTQ_001966, partial [Neisseria gonorrhoeae]